MSVDTNAKRRRPLTPWELPKLLDPLHARRSTKKKKKKERAHFPAVLAFVYRNRFAVASQIQRRFADVIKSSRTARRHLEELQGLGYLGVTPGRGVGPLFPKVYYVTRRGLCRLRKSLATQGKPWQESTVDRRGRHSREGYASDHLIHELLITEFLLALWQTADRWNDLKLLTIQRRSVAKHPAFQLTVSGRQVRLIPDAMFLFEQTSGKCCCFLELDNGTMNAKQIKQKFLRYERWSQSMTGRQYLLDLYRSYGASEPRSTFRLLIVARSRTGLDDERRLVELATVAKQVSSELQPRIWLTTVATIARRQHDERPLEGQLWLRYHDWVAPHHSDSLQAHVVRGCRSSLFCDHQTG